MGFVIAALIAFCALEHIGFMVLEMFYWTSDFGMKTFGTTPDFAKQSAVLAANQGLYNGILAAGLIWGLITGRRDVRMFFLLAVVAAGVYGGLTAKTSILFVQALPAGLALIPVLFGKKQPA
jgi:putative membrane protein